MCFSDSMDFYNPRRWVFRQFLCVYMFVCVYGYTLRPKPSLYPSIQD